MGLASINIKFSADLKQFSSEIQNSARQFKKLGSELQTLGAGLSIGLTAPILAFGVASVNAFDESAKAIAQVDAALKSTGGTVGFNSEQLQKMAADLQSVTTFDDDKILKEATANLLTFNKVTGDTFVQAQKAALDLATRLDGDLQSATLQVGKALQDPVKGITALSKAGVSFSSEQKATIKAMVATNNVAGAQSLILKELNKEFGGSAEAAAKAGTGSFKQLANQVGDLSEEFGKIIVDALQPFIENLKGVVSYFQQLSPETKKVIAVIAGVVAVLGPAILAFGTIVTLVPTFVAGLTAMSGAFSSFTAVIAANPIGAIAVALAAVVSYAVIANSRFSELTSSAQGLVDVNNKAAQSIASETSELNKNLAIAKSKVFSDSARKKAIEDINSKYPELNNQLTLENVNTEKGIGLVNRLTEALLKKAKVQASEEKLVDIQKKLLDLQLGQLDAIKPSLWQNLANATLAAGNSAIFAARTSQTVAENFGEEYSELTKLQNALTAFIGKNKDYKTSNDAVNSSLAETIKNQQEQLKSGTIGFYEKQIQNLQKLQKEQATTHTAWLIYQDDIDKVQKKIDLLEGKAGVKLPKPELPTSESAFSPSFSLEDLKNQQSYYEGLRDRFSKTSDDYKYYSEQVSNTEIKIKAITGIDEVKSQTEDLKATLVDLGPAISEGFGSAFATIAEGFGEIIANFTTGGSALISIGGLIFNTLGNLAIQVGKIAISTGIAILGIKKSLESLNPYVAIAAGVALIALGTVVKSQLASAGAFANGGIVGGSSFYGDKILARVNSGELILNSQQQKNLYGQLGTGYNRTETLISDVKISGSDLLILFNRAEKQKGRIG